jgi:hypothetical protein
MALRSAALGTDGGAATAARTENQTETTPRTLSIFARIAHDVLGSPTSCRQIDYRTDETKRVRPLRNFRLKHRSLLMSRVGARWAAFFLHTAASVPHGMRMSERGSNVPELRNWYSPGLLRRLCVCGLPSALRWREGNASTSFLCLHVRSGIAQIIPYGSNGFS